MWTLKKIKATNIQTFEELEFSLEQGVTTLVFGENRDNDVQKSNGSGKSAIIEAITVGLRGSPMRPVRIDEVINNDQTKATTEVSLYNQETDELMVISRELFKKSSNTVSLYIEQGGKPLPEESYAQSSAAEYNRFIFEKLGITEDELLNNFILSKHRYKPFLDASDREKKEVINKLSNAIIVDPVVERVADDVKDKESEISGIDMQLSGIDGSITVLTNQIDEHQENLRKDSRVDRLKNMSDDIAKHNSELEGIKAHLKSLASIRQEMSKAEDVALVFVDQHSEMSVDEAIEAFSKFMKDSSQSHTVNKLSSTFVDICKRAHLSAIEYQDDIDDLKGKIEENSKKLKVTASDILSTEEKVDEIAKEVSTVRGDRDDDVNKVKERIESKSKELRDLRNERREKQLKLSDINSNIIDLQNILMGAIECPKCSHEFFTGDGKESVDDINKKINKLEIDKESILSSINKVESQIQDCETTIEGGESEIEKITDSYKLTLESLEKERASLSDKLFDLQALSSQYKDSNQTLELEIKSNLKRIESQRDDAISSINSHLDSKFDEHDMEADRYEKKKSFHEASIETLKDNMERIKSSNIDDTIANLKEQLDMYAQRRDDVYKKRCEKSEELAELKRQNNIFADFKTYLANSKINALNFEINSFLESVGTDIRIKMDGYSQTKSGKTRDRISISVLRNGIDFGSFAKMSEGEKATVHLSTILAMQKLINSSAPSTKGLNLLVVDEILDTVDGNGLRHIFDTIRQHGVTSLIVSHGLIVENYPHKVVVVKENHVSSIMKE